MEMINDGRVASRAELAVLILKRRSCELHLEVRVTPGDVFGAKEVVLDGGLAS